MLCCLSPNGSTLSLGSGEVDRLTVGTVDGVVTAERRDHRFVVATRALEGLHISSLWYESSEDLLLAASYDGGVFASEDRGATFVALGTELAHHNVFSVAARTSAGGLVLYAGTEPVGLYLSTDRGAHWQELPAISEMPSRAHWTFPGPPHEAHLKNLTFVPGDDDHIFACVEQGGLFESRDGGVSFREIESIDQDDDDWYRDVHRLVLRPGKPRTMFISGGDGITASNDGGRSWHRVLATSFDIGYPDGFVVHPEDPDLMFISGARHQPGTWRESHSADAHIARSEDGGTSWHVVNEGLPTPLDANIEALSLAVSPAATELFAATTNGTLYASRDRGEHFEEVLTGLAPISKGGHFRPLVHQV